MENNWLRPQEIELKKKAERQCADGNNNACTVVQLLRKLDAQREQANDGTRYKGMTQALTELLMSPVTAPVELIASIDRYGLSATANALADGLAGLPARLIDGLQSDNPELQGRALTELLASGVGGAKVIGEVRDAAVAFKLSRATIEADAIKIKARLVEVAIHKDDHRFDAVAEKMAEAKAAGWKDKNGHPIWPPENGKVPGTEEQIKLPIGTELDRYGLIGSNTDFIAPKGVPYANRALPLGSNSRPLVKLVVLKPLPVEKSLVMPWFGEPGMGVQYQTTAGALRMTVGELIEHGYLRRVD